MFLENVKRTERLQRHGFTFNEKTAEFLISQTFTHPSAASESLMQNHFTATQKNQKAK